MVNKERGIYCEHLEKLMPRGSSQSVKAYGTEQIERFPNPKKVKALTIDEVEERLREFGLDPYLVELITLKYVEELSLQAIVDGDEAEGRPGWQSAKSANHYLNTALKRLRKGGFKFR